jgi:hypothetical protein
MRRSRTFEILFAPIQCSHHETPSFFISSYPPPRLLRVAIRFPNTKVQPGENLQHRSSSVTTHCTCAFDGRPGPSGRLQSKAPHRGVAPPCGGARCRAHQQCLDLEEPNRTARAPTGFSVSLRAAIRRRERCVCSFPCLKRYPDCERTINRLQQLVAPHSAVVVISQQMEKIKINARQRVFLYSLSFV